MKPIAEMPQKGQRMKKQLLHTYRFVFLCMLIVVVGLCLVAGYSVRVLDQNQVIQQVDTNMEAAKVRLDRDAEASATMMEDLRNEYASKTRVVAMLLEEQKERLDRDAEASATMMEDLRNEYASKTRVVAMLLEEQKDWSSENETILEELRVVIDADQISVSNETGILIASTDFSSTGKRAYRAFLSHTTDPVFTDVVFTMQNDKPMILAASALGSGKGLIQVQYPAESMLTQSQENDVSAIVADMPFSDMGISAIIDTDTGKYVSHTQVERCGTDSDYDESLFSGKKGKVDLLRQHQRYMIRYQTHENYILLVDIPYREMDNARGMVIKWVFASGLILLLVATLSMRMGYFYLKKKSPELFPKEPSDWAEQQKQKK